jgi:hypothetical protein
MSVIFLIKPQALQSGVYFKESTKEGEDFEIDYGYWGVQITIWSIIVLCVI